MRLRNIGGLIVIDFIDMEKVPNRHRVFMALKEALSKGQGKDKCPAHVRFRADRNDAEADPGELETGC